MKHLKNFRCHHSHIYCVQHFTIFCLLHWNTSCHTLDVIDVLPLLGMIFLCDKCRKMGNSSCTRFNFCNCIISLDSKYCDHCAIQGKECQDCHLLLPLCYYELQEDDLCMACQRRTKRRTALGKSVKDINIFPFSEEKTFLTGPKLENVAWL